MTREEAVNYAIYTINQNEDFFKNNEDAQQDVFLICLDTAKEYTGILDDDSVRTKIKNRIFTSIFDKYLDKVLNPNLIYIQELSDDDQERLKMMTSNERIEKLLTELSNKMITDRINSIVDTYLDDVAKAIVKYRYFYQLTTEAIANILNIDGDTVESIEKDTIAKLKNILLAMEVSSIYDI